MDVFNEVQSIILKTTGIKHITEDTDFIKDLSLSSFDIINIIAEAETSFKIKVQTKDLWKMHTVRDFLDYMSNKEY